METTYVSIVRNKLLWLVLVLLAGLLAGLVLRYAILENVNQARICQGDPLQMMCRLRSTLGWSIYFQLFGWGALLLALPSWLTPLRAMVWPALMMSACGLLLYNTTYAAIALIVALLAALRD